VYIGWVPLAPYEPYYCHRPWGPRTLLLKNINITNININKYAYVKHAVVINKTNLYSVKSYTKVKVSNKHHGTLARNYRGTPVLNNKVVKNYKHMSKKHQLKNVHVQQKPNRRVTGKSQQRHVVSKEHVDSKGKGRIARQSIPEARHDRRVETSKVRSPKTRDTGAHLNRADRRVQKTDYRKTEHKKKPRVVTQGRLDTRKQSPNVRTAKPVRSPRKQEVRATGSRKSVAKVQRKSYSPPARSQKVQVKNQPQVNSGGAQTNKGKSIIVPQSKPASKAQGTNYSGTRTSQAPQTRQAQPRQQKSTRSTQKGRNPGKWNF
jgi:hypothetical protein